MDIQKRIDAIKSYFVGMEMNIEDDVIYIKTKFPDNWAVSELLEENFNVKTTFNERTKYHYFYTEIKNGFNSVFNAIEYTIEMNLSALERLDLFRKKVEELKDLFDNEDIEKLKRLEFTFKKTEKKNRKPKKIVNDKVELQTEAVDTTNNLEAYGANDEKTESEYIYDEYYECDNIDENLTTNKEEGV